MRLADALARHVPADALEAAHLDYVRRFVAAREDPFDRTLVEGHCTASALVLAGDGRGLLFVYHRRLARWIQPGGHGEPGEILGEEVATREAEEETGVRPLALHPTAPRPIDVDVHRIPASRTQPAHDHLDLRYLLVAPPDARLAPDVVETRGARWFTWQELEGLPLDAALRRAIAKARALGPVWHTDPRHE